MAWKRFFMHIAVGMVAAFLVAAHWSLSLGFVYWFEKYETNQDKHKRDGAFKDLIGALWGLGIGGLIMYATGGIWRID